MEDEKKAERQINNLFMNLHSFSEVSANAIIKFCALRKVKLSAPLTREANFTCRKAHLVEKRQVEICWFFCVRTVKKIFSAVLRMNLNSHINHGEAVHIINSVGIAYHQNKVLYIIIAKGNTAYD